MNTTFDESIQECVKAAREMEEKADHLAKEGLPHLSELARGIGRIQLLIGCAFQEAKKQGQAK